MLTSISLLLLLSFISACFNSSTLNKVNGVASTSKLDTLYFPKSEIISVEISIDEAAFHEILEDSTAEAYHSANITYNGVLTPPGGMNFGGQGGNRGQGNMSQFQMGGNLNLDPSSEVPTISTEVKQEHALITLYSVIAILIGACIIVLFRRKLL